MKRSFLLLLALAVPAGTGGCSRYDLDQPPPPTVKVTGKIVTAGGQPMTSGVLRFEPVASNKGVDAYAELGADGTFTVKSFGNHEGIKPGSYVAYLDPASVMRMDASGKKMVMKPTAAGIPPAYLKPETTKWRIQVTTSTSDLGTLKLQ